MNGIFADMISHHRKFNHPVGTTPAAPGDEVAFTCVARIDHAILELIEALDGDDLAAVAEDGIGLIQVVVSVLLTYGIDPRPVWLAVHQSSMAGYDPPPPIAAILATQPSLSSPPPHPHSDLLDQQALIILEHRVRTSLRADVIGVALAEIRDRELYRAKAPTFGEYCRDVLGLGPATVGPLLKAVVAR